MLRLFVLTAVAALLAGCFNPALRVDGRTALEQQLTRTAILKAIAELPIHESVLHGRWRIEVVSPDGTDDSWTHALLRQRLVSLGADISTDASEKLPVVEALVPFAGSDIDSVVVGIPIPGSMGAASVSFYHENSERGRARIRLNFWTEDGNLLAQTPAAPGETHYSDIFVLTFIGPFSFTDLDDVETYGRFAEKGVDTWKRAKSSDATAAPTSDKWITPTETEQP